MEKVSTLPSCELCAFKEISEKCCFYNCIEGGTVSNPPTLQDQLIELYEPVLEYDFENFLSAVQRATEIPNLNEGQRIKLFRHYYKPSKINLLEVRNPQNAQVATLPEKKTLKSKWVEI